MNIENVIQWFQDRLGKVTYSMVNRNGPASFDCSSAVYHALIQGGFFPSTIGIGNTDSEFGDLEKHGFAQVPEQPDGSIPTQRGDIFIWGIRGQSAGGFGHTGIFVDADNIIHCSYGYNGIHVDNHDWLWSINGEPEVTIYRFQEVPANDPHDQNVEIGSWIKFERVYTADDVQQIGVTWQIRSNELCPSGFSWDDNGIPAGLVTEVDIEGFATDDQELDSGSRFVIPGKFHVLDVGQSGNNWLAQVGAGVLTFWVDIASATEIAEDEPGMATPNKKQPPVPIAPPSSQPAPAPIPTPDPQSQTDPVVTENNVLLKQLLDLVTQILSMLKGIFK